jgi:hypothetical protein
LGQGNPLLNQMKLMLQLHELSFDQKVLTSYTLV